jgi:hypothetical protein
VLRQTLIKTAFSYACAIFISAIYFAQSICLPLYYILAFLSLSLLLQKMKEFRHKVGTWLPAIRKNDPPQGRTEFSGINDFLQYIIDVDKEQKQRAKTVTPTSSAKTEIETSVVSNK